MKRFARSILDRERLRKFLLDQSVRSALFAFALSRVIIFVIFVLVPHVTYLRPPAPIGQDQDITITLDKMSLARTLRPLAGWGDSGWYTGIARNGYEQIPFAVGYHNWVFFPLYPLVLRAAAFFTGGYEMTGMALSSLFLFLALILLHKLLSQSQDDTTSADRAVFYLATFPTSYFFSLPHTESLFLLVSIGSLYAAQRERWALAGTCGALASASRFIGILWLPTLLLFYWQRHRRWPRGRALFIFLAPLGLLCYMLYLHGITGDAFAFKDAQAAWGRSAGFFLFPLTNYLLRPAEVAPPVGGGNFYLLHVAAALLVLFCGYKLVRRREWALAFYTLASVLIPLSSQNLVSLTRYMMVVFPIYIVLAKAGQATRVDQLIRSIFLVLLGIMTLLFAAHFTIAFT